MYRRSLLALLPACLAMPRAFAQGTAAPKYVVLSLIGDELTYVGKEGEQVGTNLNHNRHESLPTKSDLWDVTALQVIASVVPKAAPGASMSFLKGSLPEYFSDQVDWFGGGQLKLPDPLKAAVDGEHASFLLLLTKWRGDAIISDGHASRGQGKLSGLGFYSDPTQKMAGGPHGDGFTAPYVYAKLSLVDLSTQRLAREVTIQRAEPGSYFKFSKGALQDLLIAGVQDATAQVLATGPT